MYKTWNVRDQTSDELNEKLRRTYQSIEQEYKILKKVKKIEDAKRLIDEIWSKKAMANDIELELIRREYNDETP